MEETSGPTNPTGWKSFRELVLPSRLHTALRKLNHSLPDGIAASRDCAHRRPLSDAAGGGDASLDDRTIYASLAGRLPT
jgi:hypothetical protein